MSLLLLLLLFCLFFDLILLSGNAERARYTQPLIREVYNCNLLAIIE